MNEVRHKGTILVYAIHNAEAWWRRACERMGFERTVILSTFHQDGDINVRREFYRAYRGLLRNRQRLSAALDTEEMRDVVERCRVLRFLPPMKAASMVLAMNAALVRALDTVGPDAVIAWPIDNYITDLLQRRCTERGTPYIELTASPLLNRVMMLHRGRMIESQGSIDPHLVEHARRELADPLFTLPHLKERSRFTRRRYWKTFTYFKTRGLVFKFLSRYWHDPLNVHYLDSQSFMDHKPRLGDVRTLGRQNPGWRKAIAGFPRERRLFLALQVFPEASIDYWLHDITLVRQHEDVLVELAETFSGAGYTIVVKDHPLQYGFRKVGLIDRLLAIPNVVFAPYDVTGNEVLDEVGVTFTTTGTLGIQTAMRGLTTIATDPYFATPGDFVLLSSREQVPGLPTRVKEFAGSGALEDRQRRIAEKLLRGSFPGDYMTYANHRWHSDPEPVRAIGPALGNAVAEVIGGQRKVATMPDR